MALYSNITIPEATQIQNELRARLDIAERELTITTIGGADISLNLYSTTIYAGIILLSFPQLRPVAYSLIKAETKFPSSGTVHDFAYLLPTKCSYGTISI